MMRLTTHIERLLLTNDCVIVPGFGGFVSRTIPEAKEEEAHRFRPVRKEIVFNGTLRHTDGLLPESYMRMYGVDYQEARLMMDEDIESLRATLEREKRITLGRIGAFSVGEEGQVIFSPGDSVVLNADSYGLATFHFPALHPLSEEETPDTGEQITGKRARKDVFYIPISRKWARVIAASAAVVALFLLTSTPIRDVNPSAYTASFIPTEMIHSRFEAPLPPTVETPAPPTATPNGTDAAKPAKKEETAETASSAPAPKRENKPTARRVASQPKMYHIVIASFPSEEQANEYMAGVDPSVREQAGIVARDGKYRVYARKFDNRTDAENYMATLRNVAKYKDAWLFISR